ncbi:MAG: MBL fold metallo-hydrolase [Aquificae bacterium]|nr:MBL fold metallo-hydrolase [Aquificota bacterium]
MRFLVILVVFILSFSYGMQLEKVDKDIYMVRGYDGLPSEKNRGFISNAYGIFVKDGWVVIDSLSTPELAREFISLLKKEKNVPIKYLIVTHYHLDHWYGASEFKKEGAYVIAHKNLKKFYESGQAMEALENFKRRFKNLFKNVKLTPPDFTVRDEITISTGDKSFKVISMTPAHTNTDIVVYMPDRKFIFVGDLVFYKRIPFVGDSNASSKGWLKVLKDLEKMDIDKIFAGHNYPLDKKAIDFTYQYISFLRTQIAKMKDEGLFYDEIKKKLQDIEYKKFPMFKEFHNQNIYKIYNELDFEF